ncbi:uncharacterized protein K444DRAFT_212351 [Hyaloscypha bicolor E]|uniref:Uncharacterized protein n=1 Tax=Hyaloscypha bicolor E TaxID=1095630 RepID=A0A2J6TPX0_9HELO|nr:uncharacterized protein K444DRAFT_212351 [Hyaloscypha bicolor E]PMD65059.1 hypothetical protein K444DRAFT_212351 [Hyaloscypha bicolor E]
MGLPPYLEMRRQAQDKELEPLIPLMLLTAASFLSFFLPSLISSSAYHFHSQSNVRKPRSIFFQVSPLKPLRSVLPAPTLLTPVRNNRKKNTCGLLCDVMTERT